MGGQLSRPLTASSALPLRPPAAATQAKVIISSAEGHRFVVPFEAEELTVGRGEGNAVCLPDRNISRRHLRLVRSGSDFSLENLSTSLGVLLNDKAFRGRGPLQPGDRVRLGDYELMLEFEDLLTGFEASGDGEMRLSEGEVQEELQLGAAPGGRRLLAHLTDLLPMLVLFRYTYVLAPWAAYVAGVAVAGLFLFVRGGTGGQVLWGLSYRRASDWSRNAPRAAAQFALQVSWVLLLGAFLWAAYSGSPSAVMLGALGFAVLAVMSLGSLPAFFGVHRTVLDRLMGTVVLRKGS